MPIATSSEKIDLSSEKKTEELAKKVSKKLKLGDTIFFFGEMGVGKTTFIRYLINTIQKDNKSNQTEITSPTFSLLNEYQINEIGIDHYDLFRLESAKELKNLGLFEDSLNKITLIEGPQIIKEKPKNLIEFYFEYEKDHQTRSVRIKGLNL